MTTRETRDVPRAMTGAQARDAARAMTDAHNRAMAQLQADLSAPNRTFDTLQELSERRQGMFDTGRGPEERFYTVRAGEMGSMDIAFLRNTDVFVDLAPFGGSIPSPIEFMEWAQGVSGINHVAPLPITYARVGGPPDDWNQLAVIDESNGWQVEGVREVNVQEGWLMRYRQDEDGNPLVLADDGIGEPEVERIEGRFRIERTDQHGRLAQSGSELREQQRTRLVGEVLHLGGMVGYEAVAARLVMNMPECFLTPNLSACNSVAHNGHVTLVWHTADGQVMIVVDDDEVLSLITPHGGKDLPVEHIWSDLADALGMTLGDVDVPEPVRRQAPTGQRALDLA